MTFSVLVPSPRIMSQTDLAVKKAISTSACLMPVGADQGAYAFLLKRF